MTKQSREQSAQTARRRGTQGGSIMALFRVSFVVNVPDGSCGTVARVRKHAEHMLTGCLAPEAIETLNVEKLNTPTRETYIIDYPRANAVFCRLCLVTFVVDTTDHLKLETAKRQHETRNAHRHGSK